MEETKGNSEIGMQADSFEAAEQKVQTDAGSETFFDDLEQQVNGGIIDETAEVTQSQNSGSEQVTHTLQDNGSENVELPANDGVDWKKRYEDSSREAVKLREQYKEIEPFVPVLDAMKNDSGLVEHVREYLVNGGNTPKSIQEELNLDEDFIFDANEAMTEPDSDSAKVLTAQVDKVVESRVGQIVQHEKHRAQKANAAKIQAEMEEDFRKKKGMTDEEFETFKGKAQKHVLTLEDIDYLLNRDQANANVVQSTKTDMLNQMQNVRHIPTSASGANSQAEEADPNNALFDGLLGLDGELDNLFG